MTEAATLDLPLAPSTALVPDEHSSSRMQVGAGSPTIQAMIGQAVAAGNLDMVGKLMDYQDRYDAKMARRAFDAAIADAKAAFPAILRNKTGNNDKRYADFSAFAKAIDPVLSQHGLSYRFRSRQDDKIHVTCIIAHRDGHSEENTLSGGPDTSGNKNAIQAIGSTLSYLQRYSLAQALGLAAADDDDGKMAGKNSAINDEQVETLRAKIVEAGADLARFYEAYGIERLEDLPAKRFDEAYRQLAKKAAGSRMKKEAAA